MTYEERLAELGITLPVPPVPAGTYVPVVRTGNLVYVSGQIPMQDGQVAFTGKVADANIGEAQRSARICAINILAQLKVHLGALENIRQIVRISGFVNSDPAFAQHPRVINAASDLLFEVFGESAKHTRIAVGVASLPMDSMTEIDAVVEAKQ